MELLTNLGVEPLKVGEVFEAKVRDLTSEGQAVVSAPNGQTVFVSGLWLGELGKMKVTALKGRVGFAELIEVIEPKSERRSAPCKYHGSSGISCGGCPWMFVNYSAQLEAKQLRTENALLRVDPHLIVKPIVSSHNEFAYRNRVQLKSDGEKLGFAVSKTHKIVDVDDCIVLSEANRFSLRKLRVLLPNKEWIPDRTRKWTTLDLDEDTTAAEVSINKRLPFRQANSDQNHYMKSWLRQRLDRLECEGKALELFCGSGNFTEILHEYAFEEIVALEGQLSAIEALNHKNLDKVKTHCQDLFDESILSKVIKEHRDACVLLLDPPRDGFKNSRILFDIKTKIRDVFYISCDLATCARDLSLFLRNGFKIQELQPLDQFPQTPHVEILCHMRRKNIR